MTPRVGLRVLITNGGGRVVIAERHRPRGKIRVEWRTDGWSRLQGVTHWAFLPEAP